MANLELRGTGREALRLGIRFFSPCRLWATCDNLSQLGTDGGFDGENVIGENFRPMFDTEAALNTAEYLKELLSYSPSGILSMSWYERARAYANGEVAMAYCATLLAPMFELNKGLACL